MGARQIEERLTRTESAMEIIQREQIEKRNREAARRAREREQDKEIVKFLGVGAAFLGVVFAFCYMMIL
jgi:hypothetical protein